MEKTPFLSVRYLVVVCVHRYLLLLFMIIKNAKCCYLCFYSNPVLNPYELLLDAAKTRDNTFLKKKEKKFNFQERNALVETINILFLKSLKAKKREKIKPALRANITSSEYIQ